MSQADALAADGQQRDARCVHAIDGASSMAQLVFDPSRCHIVFGPARFQSTANSKRRIPYHLWWKRYLGINFPVTHEMLDTPVWNTIDQSCEYGIRSKNGHAKVAGKICINPYHYDPSEFRAALHALLTVLDILGPDPVIAQIRSTPMPEANMFDALCTRIRGDEKPFLMPAAYMPSAADFGGPPPGADRPPLLPQLSFDFDMHNMAAFTLQQGPDGMAFMSNLLERGFSQPEEEGDNEFSMPDYTGDQLAQLDGVDLAPLWYTGVNSAVTPQQWPQSAGTGFEACAGVYVPAFPDDIDVPMDTLDEDMSIDDLKAFLQQYPQERTLLCNVCRRTYTIPVFYEQALTTCPQGHAEIVQIDVPAPQSQPLVGYGADIAYMVAKARPARKFVEGDVVGFFDTDKGGTVIDLISKSNFEKAKLAGVISRSAYLVANVPKGKEVPRGMDIVCMMGYVNVKVRGPVRNGDLVYVDVRGSQPGLAVAGLHPDYPDALLIGQVLECPPDTGSDDEDAPPTPPPSAVDPPAQADSEPTTPLTATPSWDLTTSTSTSSLSPGSNSREVRLVKCLVSLVANMAGKHASQSLAAFSHKLQGQLDTKLHAVLGALKRDLEENTVRSKSNEERVATLETRLQKLEDFNEKLSMRNQDLMRQLAAQLDNQQLARRHAHRKRCGRFESTQEFSDQQTVLLRSLHVNSNLRVKPKQQEALEASGARGPWARFIVKAQPTSSGFKLKNFKQQERWIHVEKDKVHTNGKEETAAVLSVIPQDGYCNVYCDEHKVYLSVDADKSVSVTSDASAAEAQFKLLCLSPRNDDGDD